MEIIWLLIGLAIGAIIATLFFLVRKNELPEEIKTKLEELEASRDLLADANVDLDKSKGVLQERLKNAEKHYGEQKEKIEQQERINRFQSQELTESQTNLKNLAEKLDTQKVEIAEMQKKFSSEFENIANKILEEKSVKFTAQNKENIDNVLAPLSDKLKSFETKVQETYEKGLKERSALKEQVIQLSSLNQTLSRDAQNLTRALTHDNKTQGNWGELILEKILKESGLTEGEEYTKQHSTNNEEGKRIQPDFLIKLPDEKHIIIDSKVSLVAYEQFVNSEDENEQENQLKAHILSVRNHIKLLSEKNYQTGLTINSPDFVLLFMPIEPAFSLAMQKDKEVYQYAWSKNIVIVSPTTLLATIRTIASIWKQEKQNKNTQEIAKQAAALYEKFVGFLDDMEKIERGLLQADGAYKNAINKLKTGSGNLIRRTENMKKLGLNTKKQISDKFLEDED
ncbi:MAG: DNA recombination protein RmuC [Flavobacteriales bacterium]